MAMHGVTMETRYIPAMKYSNHMYINGNIYIYIILLQKCQFWRETHKLEPEHGQVPVATFSDGK